MAIAQPVSKLFSIPAAGIEGSTSLVKPALMSELVQGSAIFVKSLSVPGVQLYLDTNGDHPYELAEGDFIRPGANFGRIYLRNESGIPAAVVLSIYPTLPPDVQDFPSWLRTDKRERARGTATCVHTVAAATTWRGRLQNMSADGGPMAYVASINVHTDAELVVRVDVDQLLDATAGTTQEIGWADNVAAVLAAGKLPSHLAAIRCRTGGAAWADPPAAADRRSYYFTCNKDNGVVFNPPYPLAPQREIRVAHLTAPGTTSSFTADVEGEIRNTT